MVGPSYHQRRPGPSVSPTGTAHRYRDVMATTIDPTQLRARLDEYLARAAAGERILVRDQDGRTVALGPGDIDRPGQPGAVRRRHRSARTIDEVLAEDRGA